MQVKEVREHSLQLVGTISIFDGPHAGPRHVLERVM